jgi:death-on-curing protein
MWITLHSARLPWSDLAGPSPTLPNDEPLWIPFDAVVEINRDAVAVTGEPFHLMQPNLLDSALAVPKNKYEYGGERDVFTLAVSLLLAIARNHAFFQGNKRTAFIAAHDFLQSNGYQLDIPDSEYLALLVIKGVENEISESTLEQTLRGYIVESPEHDVEGFV